jgi:multimeric flavodoxin WrbA
MAAEVLGISGSPVPNSNTDRAVRYVLRQTGLETEFIKLCKLNMSPCHACLGCKEDNRCVINDDGKWLANKFYEAKAFVIGGYTPYSSLDAYCKTFMERMYCLRHQVGLNRGKIGVCIITTACRPGMDKLPPAAEIAKLQFNYWMMEEGIINLGSMVILGNVPCIRCGYGDDCPMSGLKMLEGTSATVASYVPREFEADEALLSMADAFGQKIRESLFGSSIS